MAEIVLDGVTNIAFGKDGKTTVTYADPLPAPPPPPSGPRVVTTLADLKAVLADDVQDVTVSGVIRTTGPIVLGRIPERIIRAERGSVIQGDGGDFHILDLQTGRGGKLTINGLTIDGGWRSNPGECPNDAAANFYLSGLDYLEMDTFVTRYSRRTGIFAINTGKLIARNGSGFAMPRDFIWSNGSRNVLIENCIVQHCGDDGIGCHVPADQLDDDRVVVIRNNSLYDTLGIKVLGGGQDIRIENNKIYAAGFYGIRLGIDPTTGEGRGAQRNITVRGNYVENVQATSLSHPGQQQGTWVFLHAPDQRVDNVSVTDNVLVRKPDNRKLLRDVYSWAGLGGYAKHGFVIDASLDLGAEAERYTCKNPGDIVRINTTTGFSR